MATPDDYKNYVGLCEAAEVDPISYTMQFAMIQDMWALGPHVIPYRSKTGAIWVHDMRHKTHRADKPFAHANMAALKDKSR